MAANFTIAIGKTSATLHAYLPPRAHDASPTVVILIVPGGSYRPGPFGWCKTAEGSDVAKWLASELNIAGVVLHYRMPSGQPKLPLLDAQAALRMLRSSSFGGARSWAEWSRDAAPSALGVMGFSAGGHLAALAVTSFQPSFGLLLYPVISMDFANHTHANTRREFIGRSPTTATISMYSAERHVSSSSPPTLLIHAQDDHVVSVNSSRVFYRACAARRDCASTLIELGAGGHPWVNKPAAWKTAQAAIVAWLCATPVQSGVMGTISSVSKVRPRSLPLKGVVCQDNGLHSTPPEREARGSGLSRAAGLRDRLLALPGVVSVRQTSAAAQGRALRGGLLPT
jgi:acetyl esterase/lipase